MSSSADEALLVEAPSGAVTAADGASDAIAGGHKVNKADLLPSSSDDDEFALKANTTATDTLTSTATTTTLDPGAFVERPPPSFLAGRVSPYRWTIFADLWAAAGPIITAYFFQMVMVIISLLYIGRMGPKKLAGGALGSMFVNVTGLAVIVGMATALDTLCSNAFGAGKKHVVGEHLQRAITSIYAACVVICIMWTQSEKILLLAGQKPEVAAIAAEFIVWSIPMVVAMVILEIAKKFLLAQGINTPVTAAMAAADVAHVAFTALCVYGFGMGFKGVPFAGVFSYAVALIVLGVYTHRNNLLDGVWNGWKWGVACDVAPFLRLAVPGIGQVGFEWWAFELCALAAGLLPGNLPLDAQVLLMNTVSVAFMVPLGLGIAASNACGNYLGANKPLLARDTFLVAAASVVCTACTIGTLLFACRRVWGYIYTNEDRVVAAVGAVIPILSLFQVFDSVQGVTGGILRSCGFQKYGAGLSVIGYYVLGLPVGLALTFSAGLGIAGLWWGLCIGLVFMATVNMVILTNTNWEKQAMLARLRSNVEEVGSTSTDGSGDVELGAVELRAKMGHYSFSGSSEE